MNAKFLLIAVMLASCAPKHRGSLDEPCNTDGTCSSPSLVCRESGNQHTCVARTIPVERRCYYESECYCVTCAEKCGDAGVKTCAYSDTSVWGSKPAVCECR